MSDNKKRGFDHYLEMAVKLRDKTKTKFGIDVFHDDRVKSSSAVQYDDQRKAWEAIAKEHDVSVAELGSVAERLVKDGEDVFPGIEGLAVLSRNAYLLASCDYGLAGNTDQFITSMIYGGKRADQWIKHVGVIRKNDLFAELDNVQDSILGENIGMESGSGRDKLTNTDIVIEFMNRNGAETMLKAFEKMDKWFDFDAELDEKDGKFVVSANIKQKRN